MTRFIALLAIVSGLLLVESRADDTAANCISPKADVLEFVEQMKLQGMKTVILKGAKAQAYLSVAREVAEIPSLPNTELIVITNEGVAAVAFVIKGENKCGYVKLTWPLHRRAMLAVDRGNI